MQCTAHKQDGDPCQRRAINGQRVCQVHGAGGNALEKGIAASTTDGRRSKYQMPGVLAGYEEMRNDAGYLDLVDEIAGARATVQSYLANYEHTFRITADDARVLLEAFESVSRLVERENKRRGSVNNAQLVLFLARVADVMNRAIADYIPEAGQAERVRAAVRVGLSQVLRGNT